MNANVDGLYRVQDSDIDKAGFVLAAAFKTDPIWSVLLSDSSSSDLLMAKMMQEPVRYCLKYGSVYSTSEQLEGIAAWTSSRYADMTLWRILRARTLRLDMFRSPALLRIGFRMQRVFAPLEGDRHKHMADRDYIYIMILGVAPNYQGQGIGGRLIRSVIEESNRQAIPIYLETETEKNVEVYEHYGFRVLQQITLPEVDLRMWQMARESDAAIAT